MLGLKALAVAKVRKLADVGAVEDKPHTDADTREAH